MMTLRVELERLLIKLEERRDRDEVILDLKRILDFHPALQKPASLLQ